jgi:Na+/proline symporter
VNPTRQNIKIGRVRTRLADAAVAALGAAALPPLPPGPMNLTAVDWAIVVAYFALSTAIGFAFTKRGGESLDEYFLSGRKVPWWLAGAAMVATTFAADTPLVVTGLVASRGVAGNWLWWNMVMSGMLTVFFFARLWRRANVMTDVEFAEIRYSGRQAAFLRGFRALYLAIPINLIIMGWVTRAMIKILTISLGLRDVSVLGMTVSGEVIAVGICFVITVAYSVAAGMWAVLWTDLVQFVIKMSAVIVLAVYSVRAVGGMDAMKAKLAVHFGSEDAALSVLPLKAGPGGFEAYAWMPLLALGVFLSVQWWAAYYPGAEPGGGGYVAQRIFSAKTERDGVLATLFFQVAHYALRPWPWIVTGLATVILYPTLQDKEAGYVHAFVDLLPTPWRGFMMAGFAAAYMSTIGHAPQLGRVVPRERLLQAVHEAERDGEALRRRLAADHRPALPRVDRRDVAAAVGRGRLALPARHRGRHRAGAHPPLVLVAHQRLVRDLGDDLVVRGLARRDRHREVALRGRRPERRRVGDGDHGGREHGDLGGGDVHDAARARRDARQLLPARAAGRPGLGAGLGAPGLRPRGDPGRRARLDQLDRGDHRRSTRRSSGSGGSSSATRWWGW